MANAILLCVQGARSAAYPQRYVSNEQRRRQKKSISPKGISSLVNSFLSLRSRTTKGTLRSLFVGIDSNLNIPLSSYLWIRTLSSPFYNKTGKAKISKLRRLEGYLKSSSDDVFPVSEDFIGSIEEILLTDKRRKGREMGRYAERRLLSGKDAEKLLNKYLSKVKISRRDLLDKLYDSKMIKHRRKIVIHLHKSGVFNSDIARVMNRSRSWVSKLKKKLKL